LRLLQEARATARLGHPGIVRIFDFGRTEHDEPFIVMELLDGESLGAALDRRKRISATRAVQMLLPIADALSCAHHKGIVHRDLKPENVFLHRLEGGRTQPKVVDFGIAILEREVDRRITQDGAVLGSPSYMSPEQARGEDQIDHRADIWSFAVVLYEAMTGELPFSGPNQLAILRQVVEHDASPATELGAGDDALWAIVERGLRKNREERWQSIRAMGSALALWLTHQGVEDDVSGASLAATWLNNETGKGVFSSRPPPPAPGQALPLDSTSLHAGAAPALATQPPAKRSKLVALLLALVVLALVGGGFVVTRNILASRKLAALPAAAVGRPAAVPAPPPPPAPLPAAAPLPQEATAPRQEAELSGIDVREPPAVEVEAPSQAAPKPRRPRRTSSTPVPKDSAAASDLKMPY
jgi:serine/threonine-protein kinase